MIYPKLYIDYLVQFHTTRDYFECHELLEEHWQSNRQSQWALNWEAFIQLAVGLYHERRGNKHGALKMYKSCLHKLSQCEEKGTGISIADLKIQVMKKIEHLKVAGAKFYDINFCFVDEQLKLQCDKAAVLQQFSWGKPSNLFDVELIHRHTRRDRSGVIAMRAQALLNRRKLKVSQ